MNEAGRKQSDKSKKSVKRGSKLVADVEKAKAEGVNEAGAVRYYPVRDNVWQELQLPPGSASLISVMTEGFEYQVIDRLAQFAGIEKGRVAELTNISPSTLSRRAAQGRFNADESDRLWRMARLLELATALFEGDERAAREWIDKPAHGLGQRSPLEMIRSSLEFATLTTLIERLEHGVLA